MTGNRRLTVVHFGNETSALASSGIASVLMDYANWQWPQSEHRLVGTFRPGSRVGTVALCARALVALLVGRRRGVVVSFHLSQRGSFLREGALLRFASLLGYATSATIHGSGFQTFAAARPRLVRWALRRTRVIIVLHGQAEATVHAVGVQVPTVVIPNAVTLPPTQPAAVAELERVVLFAGAVGRRKGVDVLLEAWRSLPPELGGFELVIAGPVEDEDVLTDLPSGVRLAGVVSRDEVLRLARTGLFAVLPSRAEAFPIFLLEVMGLGRPVLATDVGGVRGLVGDAGLIVQVGSAQALGEGLALLLRDAPQREVLAARAREQVARHFTPEIIMAQLEAAWLSLVDSSKDELLTTRPAGGGSRRDGNG